MSTKPYNKTPPPAPNNQVALLQKVDRLLEKQAYLEGCIQTITHSMYKVMDQILELKHEIKRKN